MPRFAANLSMLYTEQDFLDRFTSAAEDGFRAVEFHFPYSSEPQDVARAARQAHVQVVVFNLPAGGWDAGERGIACHPTRMDEFRAGVEQALAYARELECSRLNCLAGVRPIDVPRDMARATLISNLRYAAEVLDRHGIQLLIEPHNTRDVPGFILSKTDRVLELLDIIGADNLMLQYDVYHAQVMEGDLARTLEENLPRIGHLQIADNPGCHEPGTGEINFPFLFAHLDRIGFQGWVGCEYRPLAGTRAGLDWVRPYL